MKVEFKINGVRDLLESKMIEKKGLRIKLDGEGRVILDNGHSGFYNSYSHISLSVEQCEVLRDYLNKNLEV